VTINITNIEPAMKNAKEELQEILKPYTEKGLDLVCAEITHQSDWGEDTSKIVLKLGHTKEQAQAFYNQLNFKYNNGYGTQELYGTVLLSYGVWLSRWEYDGSEGWQVNKCPIIPSHLRKARKNK
jgi:hypothetical protein